jgi:hypothetical protein
MSSLAKVVPTLPSTIPATDGTPLSYYKLGNTGASLIVLPGAMSSALTQLELGTALSTDNTVYLFSRRSRGLSGPYPASVTLLKSPLSPNHASSPSASQKNPGSSPYPVYDPSFSAQVLQTDLNDLATLMRHTGSSTLLGISGGALLILAALLPECPVPMPHITKAIIFEPPLLFPSSLTFPPPQNSKSIDLSGITRYEKEVAEGDIAAALVTAMKIVQLGPAWLAHVPRCILRALTKMVMGSEEKEQNKKRAEGGSDEGAVTMEALAPVLRFDFALCDAMIGEVGRFANVGIGGKMEALLLGGGLSMGYIKEALGGLESVMCGDGRDVKRVEIKGVGHELLENKIRNGKVEMGIGIIRDFLRGGVGTLP